MQAEPTFQRVQRHFADHIRDPEGQPLPAGVEDRRMEIYRGLFYRNIDSFVSNAFPILKSLLAQETWDAMIRDFMVRHRCSSPYFLEISQEFIRYLQEERKGSPDDPPYMVELAHYEWVELALDVADVEPDWSAIDANGDMLKGRPVVSPTAWSLRYSYPVHQIGPGSQPTEQPALPTFLIVYRNREDHVKFMEINSVTARLLELVVADDCRSGEAALRQLAQEIDQEPNEAFFGFGTQILARLQATGILLGCRVEAPPAGG